MIKHYFKVAFRNLWKYKSQTLISVVGLAVGFACFALATLWIRYEMSYDSFHKNADRMYCVYRSAMSMVVKSCPYPLAGYLKETFPEITRATAIDLPYNSATVEVEDVVHTVDIIKIDTSFFSMFGVKLIEGSIGRRGQLRI